MDRGPVECCIGASSFILGNGGDSSSYSHYDLAEESGRRPFSRIASSSSFLQLGGRLSFLSWMIIIFLALEGGGNQRVGLATAQITLPVTRSFSKLEGSGTAEGESGGMTTEHAQQLRDHDYQRHHRLHGRVLTSTTVADFPLQGNDYYIGLYYTEISLGSPANTYYVQVDTGSDLLWVNCVPCPECPTSSDLKIPLSLYDPGSSSTSSNISCSADSCKVAATISKNFCADNGCYYEFSYGDGSTAMGYLVQDKITYDTGDVANKPDSSASANIVFGCGFNQTGDSLTQPSRATDGIMGFGQSTLSVIVQLAEQRVTTNQFAHCLQGDTGEGGIFVIGDVQESGLVYTGIVAQQPHYNVVLQSISMDGTNLDIPSSAFDTNGGDSGTIFDSGTTLAIVVDEAFDAFKDQLVSTVTLRNEPVGDQPDIPCYQYGGSDLSSVFPSVTLNFEGASMDLVPTNYLIKTQTTTGDRWCLGWQSSSSANLEGLTILGDIVLKNKLVIYDLGKGQIGWVDYNCKSSILVSNGSAGEVLNSGLHSDRAYSPLAALICSAVLILAGTFW